MFVDLSKMYGQTVTVLNKLDAKDAAIKMDAYYKQVVRSALWSSQVSRTVSTDGSVRIGQSVKVHIADRSDYMPYDEWKAAGNRDAYFTIRTGDYVILGEVSEDVTASNVLQIVKAKGGDAMQVKAFRDLRDQSVSYPSAGMESIMETLYIEGV
jgi:hypothetical protein